MIYFFVHRGEMVEEERVCIRYKKDRRAYTKTITTTKRDNYKLFYSMVLFFIDLITRLVVYDVTIYPLYM